MFIVFSSIDYPSSHIEGCLACWGSTYHACADGAHRSNVASWTFLQTLSIECIGVIGTGTNTAVFVVIVVSLADVSCAVSASTWASDALWATSQTFVICYIPIEPTTTICHALHLGGLSKKTYGTGIMANVIHSVCCIRAWSQATMRSLVVELSCWTGGARIAVSCTS